MLERKGFGLRFAAIFIDNIIITIVWIVMGKILNPLGGCGG